MRAGPPRGADERVEFITDAEAEVIVVFSSAAASQSSTTLSPASTMLWNEAIVLLCWMIRSKPLELRSTDEMVDEEEESDDIDTAVLNMLSWPADSCPTRRLNFTPSSLLKSPFDEDDASALSLIGVAPSVASRADCDATLSSPLVDDDSDGKDCLDAWQPIEPPREESSFCVQRSAFLFCVQRFCQIYLCVYVPKKSTGNGSLEIKDLAPKRRSRLQQSASNQQGHGGKS